MAFGWQPEFAQADGTILRVPDDYATIQEAINAAHDGDTIQVAATDENNVPVTYRENLVISKSLTLIGSLTASFEPTTTLATIDGQFYGRTIWITPDIPTAGVLAQQTSLSVTIEGFAIGHGNATDLGGAYVITADLPAVATAAAFAPKQSYNPASSTSGAGLLTTQDSALPDIAAWAGDATARLDRLQQHGLLPVDAAEYGALRARVGELAAVSQQVMAPQAGAQQAGGLEAAAAIADAAAPVGAAPLAAQAAATYDCGGGIYSKGAGIVLRNLEIYSSFGHHVAVNQYDAAAITTGYGGGACIVDAPDHSVVLDDVTFGANTASESSVGYGGGMLLQNTVGAVLTKVDFEQNYALKSKTHAPREFGLGGGLALINAPETQINSDRDLNLFISNVASTGMFGLGGGLYVADSEQVSIEGGLFSNNIACGGQIGSVGMGGAVRSLQSNMLEMTNLEFSGNVASVSGPGTGGALSAFTGQDLDIADSKFQRNAGSQGPGQGVSGAIDLDNITTAHLLNNKLLANVAAAYPDVMGLGGAVGIWNSSNVAATGNEFAQNVGAAAGEGHGGAMIINDTQAVTVYANKFQSNWAAMFGVLVSSGGGVEVGHAEDTTVVGNKFYANMGVLYSGELSHDTIGEGGALVAFAVDTMAVATNVFSGNVALTTGITGFGSEGLDGGGVAINRGKPKAGLAGQVVSDADGASTDVTIVANDFINNVAVIEDMGPSPVSTGGGLRLTAVGAQVQQNHFEGNRTCGVNCSGSNNGGALAVLPAIEADFLTSAHNVIDGNTFTSNWGRYGMAMIVASNLFTITNNVFAGNQATGPDASALSVSVYLPPEELRPALIANNTLYDNLGGAAMGFDGWDESLPAVINNVVVSHTVGITTEAELTVVQLDYNLFNNNVVNVAGPGIITNSHPITGAVRFVDAAGGVFNLMPNSLAIDAGDPAGAPPAPAHDIDWADRPYGDRVDVGAYEWHGQGAILPFVWK